MSTQAERAGRKPHNRPYAGSKRSRPGENGRPSGQQVNLLSVFQWLIMAGLLVFIIMMLLSGNAKEVDLSTIEQKMMADPSVAALAQKNMGDAVENFSFGRDLAEEGLYWRMDDIMDVNELLIVRVADDTDRASLIEAVEKYLEDKTNAFDGYGASQYDLLKAAISTEQGEYYFFGVSEEAAQWEAEFLECIK